MVTLVISVDYDSIDRNHDTHDVLNDLLDPPRSPDDDQIDPGDVLAILAALPNDVLEIRQSTHHPDWAHGDACPECGNESLSVIESRAHTSVFRRRSSGHCTSFPTGIVLSWPHIPRRATESVRAGPEREGAVNDRVVHTAMTWIPMGPHWPGHSPTAREETTVPPACRRFPLSAGWNREGVDSRYPVDGFHVLQGVEEVKSVDEDIFTSVDGEFEFSKTGDALGPKLSVPSA